MAISRGSVRHTIAEDLYAFAKSTFRPTACALRATPAEKARLAEKINRRFGLSQTVPFPYARTCVHAVLEAMRLPPGSEVLMTPINIGPMLEVVLSLGLRPLFVDIELDTFGPDLDDLARKLQRKPAAFLLTYLFGAVPQVEAILQACDKSGTRVIEDISQNIGATYAGRLLGTFGEAAVYSASLLKYVDGYNGAFLITDNPKLGHALVAAAEALHPPDRRRIQACIRRTLIWNIALNRHMFNLGTFPVLSCLKALSPIRFEKLLGPGIPLRLDQKTLPNYYFEDIATIQCRTIIKQLDKLDTLLEARQEQALIAFRAWQDVTTGTTGLTSLGLATDHQGRATFWQFVIPVKSVAQAREVLFRHHVETGTTNLPDLAHASGIELPNARALKERRLFVPLHSHMRYDSYAKLFSVLRNAGQI